MKTIISKGQVSRTTPVGTTGNYHTNSSSKGYGVSARPASRPMPKTKRSEGGSMNMHHVLNGHSKGKK